MTSLRAGTTSRTDTPSSLAITGGYLALSTATFLLAMQPDGAVTALWFPPAGLAYGFLLRTGARGIPVVALALSAGITLTGSTALTSSTAATSSTAHAGELIHLMRPSCLLIALGTAIALAIWYGIAAVAQRRLWDARPTYTALSWFALFGLAVVPTGGAAICVLSGALQSVPVDIGVWARGVIVHATAVATLTPVLYLLAEETINRTRLTPVVEPSKRRAVICQAAVFTWASIVLAACVLVLGTTAEARFGDSMTTFSLQAVMFAGAVATLFAGAGLISQANSAATARRAALQTTHWRALVQADAAVVARIGRDGRWTVEPDSGHPGAAEALVTQAACVPSLASAVLAGSPATVAWRAPQDPGRRFVTHVTPLPDGASLAVTTETTGLHSAEVALAWDRGHDRETDLPNRDLLLATAEHALMEGTSVSLILVDVERAGWRATPQDVDPARLMLVLAERLRALLDPRELSQGQALVARVGDDQFGVLVPTQGEASRRTAEQMVTALRETIPTPRTPLALNAWAGVAQLEPDRTPRETLRLAATALHAAIERRSQTVVVLDDLSVNTAAERALLVGEVVGAIGRGELDVVFQPDVALPDGRLTGVEALVRWRRPEGFATATDLFVQLAEEAGAVQAVDAWVMEESLHQLGTWRRDHPRPTWNWHST